MADVRQTLSSNKWAGYFAALFGIAAVTGALKLFGGPINSTTVALAFYLPIPDTAKECRFLVRNPNGLERNVTVEFMD